MRPKIGIRVFVVFVIFVSSAVVLQLEQVSVSLAQGADLGGRSPTNRIAITSVVPADRSLAVDWEIATSETSAQLRWRVKDAFPSADTVHPSSWSTATLTGASLRTSYTIRSLINGVTYEIQARAHSDENGDSDWSNTASAVPSSSTAVDSDVALRSLSIEQSSDGSAFSALTFGQSPAFSSNLTDYYVVLLNASTHLRLNPESINGQALIESRKGSTSIRTARNGSYHSVSLDPGDNTISLRVSTSDNSKSQVYNIHVLRLVMPPEIETPIVGAVDGSPSATLKHDAPPTGFSVGIQIKSTSEQWGSSPMQLPTGVTLVSASSTGSSAHSQVGGL